MNTNKKKKFVPLRKSGNNPQNENEVKYKKI